MIRLFELECPNCGANLTQTRRNACKCKYCNAHFLIDRSNPIEIKIVPRQTNNNGTLVAVLIVCLIAMMIVIGSYINYLDQHEVSTPAPVVEPVVEQGFRSPYFISFVEKVYGKPVDEVTEEELARIKYIKFIDKMHKHYIDYIIDEEEVQRVQVDNDFERRTWDLHFFTGLEELDIHYCTLDIHDLDGLDKLHTLTIGTEPRALVNVIPTPENIKKLKLYGCDQADLAGIEVMKGLESLCVDDNDLKDITAIANLPKLKSFSVDADELVDFRVLLGMSQLQEVMIASRDLKDASFIGEMSQLTSVGLENTKIKDINFLVNLQDLKELNLGYESELDDYSVLKDLTGLTSLSVHGLNDYSLLSNLTELECLHISGGGSLDFRNLSKMQKLKEFSLSGSYGEPSHLSELKNLQGLESLSLTNMKLYEDVSPAFSLPNLKTLNLGYNQLSINMNNVNDENNIESLNVNNVRIVANVKSVSQGFVTMVDYDKISFNEFSAVIEKCPKLKKLYMTENEIDNIAFVLGLPELEVLDITDNYVKDLTPLNDLINMKTVYCAENPITLGQNLKESIEVITEKEDD